MAQEKELLERLRAMQLDKKDGSDDDYVHVPRRSHVNEKAMTVSMVRKPEGLSVSDTKEWQRALLKDPRSR